MKSKVFRLAHSIKSNFENWSQALTAAWKIVKASLGYQVKVTFAKSTGELREANIIALGTLSTLEKGFCRFVEMVDGKSQWRSFRLDRMVF